LVGLVRARPQHQDDIRTPPMTPAVFEGKYELDSLAAFLKLSRRYFEETGDAACFADDVSSLGGAAAPSSSNVANSSYSWRAAVALALDTIDAQRAGSAQEANAPGGPPYLFQRDTTVATDTMMQSGNGVPAADDVGLVKSNFRPSDDATTLPFLVPANAMAVRRAVRSTDHGRYV
jgi:meiotically up-regulated gene 157 (Mug157) protein